MAKLDLSGISKLGGYLLSNEGPLDVRTVVTEKAHLTELVKGRIAYPGMIVYVNSGDADKGLYVCDSNTANGEWRPITTTDTTYSLSAPKSKSDGNVTIVLKAGDTTQDSIKIKGAGAATVTSNTSGEIVISSTNTITDAISSKNIVANSTTALDNTSATNGNVYLNNIEDAKTVTSSHKITGSGATTVTSDTYGNITITTSAGTNINTNGSKVSLYEHPSVCSLGIGDTSNAPVSLQYDSSLGAIKFVFN